MIQIWVARRKNPKDEVADIDEAVFSNTEVQRILNHLPDDILKKVFRYLKPTTPLPSNLNDTKKGILEPMYAREILEYLGIDYEVNIL